MSNELTKLDDLELKSFDQLFDLADRLSKAGGFLPKIFEGKPGAVLACILKGRELGFTTMASFAALFVMNFKGDFRIGIYADAQLAILVMRGYKYEWVETTDKVATIKLTSPGIKDFELSYTMANAITAGLANKDIWKAYPAQMLRARATSAVVKARAPEVMHGVYSKEELDDMQPDEKVIEVQADARSGNATLLAAINLSSEVKPVDDEKSLEVVNDEAEVVHEVAAESESFNEMYTMIDTSKNKDELEVRGGIIKCHTGLSAEEKEILREKYRNKMADMEAKDDE